MSAENAVAFCAVVLIVVLVAAGWRFGVDNEREA